MIQIYLGSNEIEIDGKMTGLGYAVDSEGAYVYPRHGEYRKIRLPQKHYALVSVGDTPHPDHARLEADVKAVLESLNEGC